MPVVTATRRSPRGEVYLVSILRHEADNGNRLESTLSILSSLTTASATSSSSCIDESEKSVPAPNAFAPLAATVEDVVDDDEIDVVDHTCASDSGGEAPSSAHTTPDLDEDDFILEDDAIRQFHESINFLLVRKLPSPLPTPSVQLTLLLGTLQGLLAARRLLARRRRWHTAPPFGRMAHLPHRAHRR